MTFGARLCAGIAARGNLCVGIDPHPALLESWGIPLTADGLARFGEIVIEHSAGRVAAVKPQIAFFEAFGSRGFGVLERLLNRAADTDLIVIADAKRGDIGSTNTGYASAWLEETAPFVADALTISPYLGPHALDALVDTAIANDKGVYMLAATSNPEAASVQQALNTDGQTVAELVVAYAAEHVSVGATDDVAGDVGVVVGATLDAETLAHAWTLPRARRVPILAPGFGAQGAVLASFQQLYGSQASCTLASVSRSILRAGPTGLAQAIDAANRELS